MCLQSLYVQPSIYIDNGCYQRPQGQTFFGLGLGLVLSGRVLGLVQRWPRSHLGWLRALVVNHQNLS